MHVNNNLTARKYQWFRFSVSEIYIELEERREQEHEKNIQRNR